jgi:hypothetical protein
MKAVATVFALLVALQASDSNAQWTMTTNPPQSTAFGVDPIIRITATFRTTMEVGGLQAVPDPRAQEAARRAIYTMAANECAILSETFKAECRLGNVSILSPPNPVASASQTPGVMTGTANYELRATVPSSGR